MDSVLEKFSIFDFFNLIFTGIIFLISLQFIGLHLFDYISSVFYNSGVIILLLEKFSTEGDNVVTLIMITYFMFMLAILYLIGSFIQELGSFIQNKLFKIQDNAISSILSKNSIINNSFRKDVCINEAKKLFERKNISFDNEQNTKSEESHYFYTYCIYYVQVREQHKKPEKMRSLQGISSMLSTSFGVSSLCGIVIYFFQPKLNNIIYLNTENFILILMIYILLSIIFWLRMKKHIIYRIRMILNTYEAIIDKESL